MPWSSQSGGGGGWKSGDGNGNGDGGPWGGGGGSSGGSGSGGGGGKQNQPDLEELLKRSQDRIKNAMPGGGMSGGLLSLLLIGGLLAAGWLLFTVRVQPEERGIVLRFGEYVRSLEPGLNFRLPYPVEQVYLPKVTRVSRVEVGFRGQASRFDQGGNITRESLMLTGDENIVDIDFVVLWAIKDAEQFLFNIQNPQNSVKEVAESAMREVVGKNEIQPILTQERGRTETAVKELMQTTLDTYGAGIDIRAVQLQQVDPPKQVIDAFRDVQAARADQERLENEAKAYANGVVPEARGQAERIKQASEAYKEQTIAQAEGQANRFDKIYIEYKKAPVITRRRMFLETMERVLGSTDKIILDGKSGQGVVPYLPLNELNKSKPAGGQ